VVVIGLGPARIRAEATDDRDDAVAVGRFEKAGGRFLRGSAVAEDRGRSG
jgi:hypothetical protein